MKPQNSSRAKAPRSRSFDVLEENTLMPFLLQVLHDQSRTAVKSFLAHKLVQVNNRITTQFDSPLKPGDTVSVGMNKSAAPFHHPMLNLLKMNICLSWKRQADYFPWEQSEIKPRQLITS